MRGRKILVALAWVSVGLSIPMASFAIYQQMDAARWEASDDRWEEDDKRRHKEVMNALREIREALQR